MKLASFIAVLFLGIFTSSTSSAQTAVAASDLKYETIKVWGNCGMCKETIEEAAKKAGATSADWNEESKELKVTYAPQRSSSEKIQKKIAKSGYDTKDFTATDKAYNALHGCCKYDRKDAASN
ncbi:MAG: copper chaperone [Chitinophagaceae bacterium]|nr:MAG: copper chaperone [Chitinophagaceae bacterium]